MDLLSPSEKLLIDEALKSVTDTLHRSPIKLFIKQQNLDLRQTNTTVSYIEYDLKCIVRLDRSSDNKEGIDGSRPKSRFEAKFHIRDFIDVGLVTPDGELLFNSVESYIYYNEDKYRLLYVVAEDIAVRIKVESSPNLI